MSVDPSAERFEQAIQILPEDIDFFGHVNNVVYLRWVQDMSTVHWFAAATEGQKAAIGWVVKRREINYLDSACLSDEIVGRTWSRFRLSIHVFHQAWYSLTWRLAR